MGCVQPKKVITLQPKIVNVNNITNANNNKIKREKDDELLKDQKLKENKVDTTTKKTDKKSDIPENGNKIIGDRVVTTPDLPEKTNKKSATPKNGNKIIGNSDDNSFQRKYSDESDINDSQKVLTQYYITDDPVETQENSDFYNVMEELKKSIPSIINASDWIIHDETQDYKISTKKFENGLPGYKSEFNAEASLHKMTQELLNPRDDQIEIYKIQRKISDKMDLAYIKTKRILPTMDPRDFSNLIYCETDGMITTMIQTSVVSKYIPEVEGNTRVFQHCGLYLLTAHANYTKVTFITNPDMKLPDFCMLLFKTFLPKVIKTMKENFEK